MCDVSIQPVVSGVIMHAVEVSACARSPFGETMRSPDSGDTQYVRSVILNGNIDRDTANAGGIGVRPLCSKRDVMI